MSRNTFEGYILVIDTELYAGNFERPMCAYATGQVGECGVGEEEAQDFEDAFPKEAEEIAEIICSLPDEHGCHRPASIYPTPGYFNDGLGHHYKDEEWGSKKVIKTYQEARQKENDLYIANAKRWGWDQETIDENLENRRSEPSKFPSYQSVAIFFSEIPSDKLLDLMVKRVKEFCIREPKRPWNSKIPLIGIRIIKEEILTTEIKKVL